MATTNPITGDALVSKPTTDNYRDNYDRIFGADKPARSGKGLQHMQTPQAGSEYRRRIATVLGLCGADGSQEAELPTVLGTD